MNREGNFDCYRPVLLQEKGMGLSKHKIIVAKNRDILKTIKGFLLTKAFSDKINCPSVLFFLVLVSYS